MSMTPNAPGTAGRDISIDRFRGFIVFCMVFFVGAGDFPALGFLARIANTSTVGRVMLFKGMSLADLADPTFLFIISISYRSSFDRRFQRSGKKAYLHFLLRYLSFIGVGSIIVSAEDVLIMGSRDPLLLQTILTYIVFAAAPVSFILKRISGCPQKLAGLTGRCAAAAVAGLGLIGIVLGIRDDVIIVRTAAGEGLLKHWSILHEIGMTGLLMLPLVGRSLKTQICAWFCLTSVYTAVQLLPPAITYFDYVVLGGFAGTFGWLILMLGSVILITLYRREKQLAYFCALGVLALLAAVTCIVLPMNTSAVTVGYVLFALLCAAAMFTLINLLRERHFRFSFFLWWGENPLLLFLIGILVRGLQRIWGPPADTPLWLALLCVFGVSGSLTVLAYLLHRKHIVFKF